MALKIWQQEASDVRRLKENLKKKIVAWSKCIPKGHKRGVEPKRPNARENYKKSVRPAADRRAWVSQLQTQFSANISLSCQAACLSQYSLLLQA